MQIRQATKQDAEIISKLNADVQQIHADAYPHLFKQPSTDSFPPATACEILSKPDNHIFIGEVGGAAIGYIYAQILNLPENPFRYATRQIYIHHISISPVYQKHGYGEKFVEAVKDLAKERGITNIGLDVWSFNTNATRFFEKQGFTIYNQRMRLHTDL